MKNIFEEEIEMKNKNYALSPTAETPATTHKKEGKFRLFIMKIGKRNIIITASVLLIGVAVLLNWVLFSGGKTGKDGYKGYDKPNGSQEEQKGDDAPTDQSGTYFSATQVSRQRARDEALEVLQSVVDNKESSETVKTEALAGIAAIADEIQKEANIESLVTAKGFEQCVAVISGEKVQIVVKAEELQPAQIAQINEIVYAQTGIAPTGVTIINKK